MTDGILQVVAHLVEARPESSQRSLFHRHIIRTFTGIHGQAQAETRGPDAERAADSACSSSRVQHSFNRLDVAAIVAL